MCPFNCYSLQDTHRGPTYWFGRYLYFIIGYCLRVPVISHAMDLTNGCENHFFRESKEKGLACLLNFNLSIVFIYLLICIDHFNYLGPINLLIHVVNVRILIFCLKSRRWTQFICLFVFPLFFLKAAWYKKWIIG